MSTDAPRTVTAQVSVVVAVHGNIGALPGLLEALADQRPATILKEVVIVDNHPSPKLAADFGQGSMPACTVRIVHEPSLGLSRARNAGIRSATGDFILVTDPYSRPHPGWAAGLAGTLEDSDAFCVGGRTIAVPSSSGRIPGDVLGQFVPVVWPAARVELREPYWLVGCNLAFRRCETAYFDESLGVVGRRHLACEDLEFVIRAQLAGKKVMVAPDAVVDRAVHPRDLRLRALLHRSLWHGVSMARVRRIHGASHIHDSYRIWDVLSCLTRRPRSRWITPLIALARIGGFRVEQLRIRAGRHGKDTA